MTKTIQITSLWKLIIAIFLCEAVGITSALISNTNSNVWLQSLHKPSWNPPAYLFGPVWTVLYLLMGISLWFIWVAKVNNSKKIIAIIIFIAQLFFNFCWSIIFFKYHLFSIAFFDIVLLLMLIIMTMVAFFSINKNATYLLIPYVLWVSFATCLNLTLWSLN